MVYLASSPGLLRGRCYSVLHMHMTSHHCRYQRAYFFQPIESYWKDRQTEILNSLQGKSLILSGDGRCDSPGFSAMYCTYSLMDTETKLILHSETLKRSEVNLHVVVHGVRLNFNCSTSKFIPMLICTGQGLVQGDHSLPYIMVVPSL